METVSSPDTLSPEEKDLFETVVLKLENGLKTGCEEVMIKMREQLTGILIQNYSHLAEEKVRAVTLKAYKKVFSHLTEFNQPPDEVAEPPAKKSKISHNNNPILNQLLGSSPPQPGEPTAAAVAAAACEEIEILQQRQGQLSLQSGPSPHFPWMRNQLGKSSLNC